MAHNMRTTCRHNMASFPAQPFCSSFYHHIALVCAKTQGPNAHLAPVLEFLLDFQRKNGLNEVTCVQLFRNFWILTCTIDFFGCSIKNCLYKTVLKFLLSYFYLELFNILTGLNHLIIKKMCFSSQNLFSLNCNSLVTNVQ